MLRKASSCSPLSTRRPWKQPTGIPLSDSSSVTPSAVSVSFAKMSAWWSTIHPLVAEKPVRAFWARGQTCDAVELSREDMRAAMRDSKLPDTL